VLIIYLGVLTRNSLQEYNYIGRDVRDTIVINGQGKVEVKPDVTTVTLGVYTEGETVEAVQTENTNKMNNVINMVKELGIDEKDIKTLNFTVNPRYNWKEEGREQAGYEINQNIEIKVRDQEKISKLLSEGAMLGANQIGGLNFTINDPSSFEQQARMKAVKDAEIKAKELANELGLTLVRVVSFYENAYSDYPTPYYGGMERAIPMDAVMMPEANIESGSQTITSNVSVTFEVR